MTSNPHLSAATAAGGTDHVDVARDRGNDQWWDWYVSLADNPAEAGPVVEEPPAWTGPLPADAELPAELATPYPLPAGAVDFFAAESYVKLPGVLSPGAVERLRVRLRELLAAAVDPAVGFQSLELMWPTDPLVRAAVLSPRIGNRTTVPRMVLATTYFADGARVVPAPTMVSGDWQKFVPGTGPGEVVASERNPVLGS